MTEQMRDIPEFYESIDLNLDLYDRELEDIIDLGFYCDNSQDRLEEMVENLIKYARMLEDKLKEKV